MKKKIILILVILVVLIVSLGNEIKVITLTKEDIYNKEDAGSFNLYYKDKKGNYIFVEKFYFDKNISSKEFKIDTQIYGIKIEKTKGYELNIDELTLNGNPPKEFEKKLASKDNDVIEITDEQEFNISGKGVLIISGREPLKLRSSDNTFKFPPTNEKLTYKLNKNKHAISENNLEIPDRKYLFYHLDEVKSGSGHPTAPIDYYITNDSKYLYILNEVFLDNTFDHGKDYSKVYIYDKNKVKEYKVNTTEDNQYGKWWYEYTTSNQNIKWQHMIYLIKIPLNEISSSKNIKLSFEYYGTASPSNTTVSYVFNKIDEFGNKLANAEFELIPYQLKEKGVKNYCGDVENTTDFYEGENIYCYGLILFQFTNNITYYNLYDNYIYLEGTDNITDPNIYNSFKAKSTQNDSYNVSLSNSSTSLSYPIYDETKIRETFVNKKFLLTETNKLAGYKKGEPLIVTSKYIEIKEEYGDYNIIVELQKDDSPLNYINQTETNIIDLICNKSTNGNNHVCYLYVDVPSDTEIKFKLNNQNIKKYDFEISENNWELKEENDIITLKNNSSADYKGKILKIKSEANNTSDSEISISNIYLNNIEYTNTNGNRKCYFNINNPNTSSSSIKLIVLSFTLAIMAIICIRKIRKIQEK